MNRLVQSATPKEPHLKAWILTGSLLSAWLYAQPIGAQVIPDATLPAGEQSQVTGTGNVQIDGGTRRGSNLFHSFSQFSIPTGGSAFFNNATDVQTIFSRVTGGSLSNIDGLIRANGTANLFFLNPNGILFGPNAQLNIGGSFVATTANAIGFPNGEVFSSDVTQPLPSPLLNVSANALFFNQLAAQEIVNQSTANNGTGLQVPAGQSLLLVGGDVRLEGGQIISPGSRVELGAVAGQGNVGLSEAAGEWRLSVPDSVTRSDVFLSNGSIISVRAGGGGSIAITARNLTLSQVSRLRAGINDGLGFAGAQAGDVEINATETVSLDGSTIGNLVRPSGIGNAGNINITAGSFAITGGTQLDARTNGQGNAGSVNINARDTVFLDGSFIYNTVEPTAVGNGGDINITTGSLALTGGAQLILFTKGQRNVGDVNIDARDTVFLDGSFIYNTVEPTTTGNGGDINITTGSLTFTGGTQLILNTSGERNAGSVNIDARDTVFLDGSFIFNTVEPTATGNGGDINITTGSLALTERAALIAITYGQGDAGSVTINARDTVSLDGSSAVFNNMEPTGIGNTGGITITTGSLALTGGAQLQASAEGQGIAGSVTINARDTVSLDGSDSVIYNEVAATGIGNTGGITITTGSLALTGGAQLFTRTDGQGDAGSVTINAGSLVLAGGASVNASTGGQGDAGNITVSADTVSLSGGGRLLTTTFSNGEAGDITVNTPNLQLSGATSGLFAQTTTAADAGDLTIQPRDNGQSVRVNLQDGAQISASTSSSGRGGTLTITAPDSITLTGNGSIIAAETGGTGTGGNLFLTTGDLRIQDQAQVTVSSSNTGSAGNLFVDANRIYLNNQASIRADTSGGGGNIALRSPLIFLRNGSNISTNATGASIPGGNISIATRFLIAVSNEDSNISANSEDFRGGNVHISAFSIYGIQPRPNSTPLSDITATGATSTLNGTIDVTTAGIDPTSGLVELPTDLVDASGLIAQGCPADKGNSFVISGRGGLPPTPEQQLDDDAKWSDRRRLVVVRRGRRGAARTPGHGEALNSNSPETPHPTPYTPIIEATGWQIMPNGVVVLVATTPVPTVQNRLPQPVACQGR